MAITPQHDWSANSRHLGDLLSRVGLGDRQAFAELYRHSAAHLLGVVLRICPQRALAEDLLQEIFINVWRAAQQYDAARSQPMTWLTSIARNRAIDAVRRGRTEPTVADPGMPDDEQDQDVYAHHADPGPGPQQWLQQAGEAAALQQCMGGLSAAQRQCLALAYYQGLSHAEVAAHIGQPLGSVKSWVRRGLQALKDCLDRLGAGGAA